IYGLEADITAPLGDAFMLKAGAAYTHARYENFPNAIVQNPVPAGGNVQVRADVSDNEVIRTPEYSAFATLTYERPLPVGELEASGTLSYNSGYYWDPANRLKQPEFVTL